MVYGPFSRLLSFPLGEYQLNECEVSCLHREFPCFYIDQRSSTHDHGGVFLGIGQAPARRPAANSLAGPGAKPLSAGNGNGQGGSVVSFFRGSDYDSGVRVSPHHSS